MPLARSMFLAFALALAAPTLGGAVQTGVKLGFPADCKLGETCEIQGYFDHDPARGSAKDYHCGPRAIDGGDGVDVRLPTRMTQTTGVKVLAAAPGRVVEARGAAPDFPSAAEGAKDPCGNKVLIDHGGGWITVYCHLAKGSLTVKPGAQVAGGQPLGLVGQSGAASFPGLHFGVTRNGVPVDPFAPDGAAACRAQGSLWDRAAQQKLSYRPAAVLNAGFTGDPALIEHLETTRLPPPVATDRGVVAYVRAVGLTKGDEQELTVKGPTGAVVAGAYPRPLDTARPEHLIFVGKAREAAEAWPRGGYTATYVVRRAGKVVLSKTFSTTL
jgi:murein DD-endopeptidase MepM/ murein hydrolase activator NlpD